MRYRLRTLLIVLAIGPPMVWTGYNTLVTSMVPDNIQTPTEFNSLIESGPVIIHLDVDWSATAMANRPLLARLRSKVLLDTRCRAVRWQRIDCTDSNTPISQIVTSWLQRQKANPWAVNPGCGSLLWIKDGQLIDWLSNPASEKEDKLFERTLKVFPKT